MSPRALLWLLVASAVSAAAWSGSQIGAAKAAASSAMARHQRLVQDADEIARLRVALADLPTAPAEQTNLVGDVNAALLEAGVPVSALTALTPDSDSALAAPAGSRGPAFHRQSARLTIEQVTLPQLGRFFTSWCKRQPRWTVSSIQLQPSQSAPPARSPASGGPTPQPLRAYLVIESTYLAPASQGTPP